MSIPIRVSDELLEDAKQQIKMSYRSLTKQIEFWAQIGKEAEVNMTPADVAALVSGEVEIKVVRKKSEPVDFDGVFDEIESDRKAGTIKSKVLKDKVWYEESPKNPGMFFRMTTEGEQTLGKFSDGKFIAKKAIKKMAR
ncbi:MAG: TA system antitoxin ParD family protein [Pseudobdellovibrionaceae bacterium]